MGCISWVRSLFIELYKINNSDLLIIKNFNIFAPDQPIEDDIQNFIFTFGFLIFIIGQNFPKYNPIYRWNISRKLKRDFIKQEPKTTIIVRSQSMEK